MKPGTGPARRRRRLVDLTDRRALAARLDAPEEVVAQARRLKESALLDLGIAGSPVASWLYAKCHYQFPTTAVDTAAVVATGDGSCLLLYNPQFFVDIGIDGVTFVLFHEARHIIQRHLHVDPELLADPVFELAAEVTINHVALTRLRRLGLPIRRTADNPDGEPTGIDPREIHRSYRKDLLAQGQTPRDYDEFVETDLTVYGELKRMTRPPVPSVLCVHLAEGDGDGVPLDPETVNRIGAEVLAEVMRRARNGDRAARQELLDLADRAEDGSEWQQRVWGSLGLAALRGHTPRTRRVDWWKRWLVDTLASKLREGERLVYPKKLGAVLLSLGMEPMLSRRGRERLKVVLIALDTSGSMPDSVVEWLTTLVGQTDGVEAHWVSFDGAVMPFRPGERVLGGGGTSFQNVVDYAEGRYLIDGKPFGETVDAVIMLTDGYAPAVTPRDPDKWIWLITDGGDTWPDRYDPPMSCHRVSPEH